jgi:hypothetical protein
MDKPVPMPEPRPGNCGGGDPGRIKPKIESRFEQGRCGNSRRHIPEFSGMSAKAIECIQVLASVANLRAVNPSVGDFDGFDLKQLEWPTGVPFCLDPSSTVNGVFL